MNGIIWLASYPKSGNTWFRAFLTNLRSEEPEPADINELTAGPLGAIRTAFDDAVGIETSDLTAEEIDELRPAADELIAEEAHETLFLKIHDAYTYLPDGKPLISEKATLGTIYFIRNPLDVAVSYAHHEAKDVDRAIDMMADPEHALFGKPDRLYKQLRQRLLTWSGHVMSWANSPARLHLVRYEDMHAKPMETFCEAVKFAGLEYDADRIQQAIRASDFDVLQLQEREHGFGEKNPRSESFFRKGTVGSWREVLTHKQQDRIISHHEHVMRRFGYLTENGQPVY